MNLVSYFAHHVGRGTTSSGDGDGGASGQRGGSRRYCSRIDPRNLKVKENN